MIDDKYLFRVTKLWENWTTSQDFRFPSGKLLFHIRYDGDTPKKISFSFAAFSLKGVSPKFEDKVLISDGYECCFKKEGETISVYCLNHDSSREIRYTILNGIDPDFFEPAPLIIKNAEGETVVEVIYQENENIIFSTYYNGELCFVSEKGRALDYLRYLFVPYQMFKDMTFWQHLFSPTMDYNKMGYFINETNEVPLPVKIAIYMLGELFSDKIFYSIPGPSAD